MTRHQLGCVNKQIRMQIQSELIWFANLCKVVNKLQISRSYKYTTEIKFTRARQIQIEKKKKTKKNKIKTNLAYFHFAKTAALDS